MSKNLSTNFKIDWKSHIKKLTFAYYNTLHKTTGFSPHVLLFGRNGRLQIDLIFDFTVNGIRKTSTLKIPTLKIPI